MSIALPAALLPNEGGRGEERQVGRRPAPLRPVPGTPPNIVQACRQALSSAAASYGKARVEVVSAGQAERLDDGTISAPVEARVTYVRGTKQQIRQAEVDCRLDEVGEQVIATL